MSDERSLMREVLSARHDSAHHSVDTNGGGRLTERIGWGQGRLGESEGLPRDFSVGSSLESR